MIGRISLIITGLVGLVAGCMWVVNPQAAIRSAAARTALMPETPHMILVASDGKSYGQLTEEELLQNGVTIFRDWKSAKMRASEQPLDAFLMNDITLAQATDDDRVWLQTQLDEGVVLVGLGVNLDQFAKSLGLETLRAPGEANVPLRSDEAFLIYALLLGQPDDTALMRANQWLTRALRGEETNLPGIKAPLITHTGTVRSQLTSKEEVDRFFLSLRSTIEGVYQSRLEYQQSGENLKGNDNEN